MTKATRAALVHLLTAALRLLTDEGSTAEPEVEEWKPRWLGDVNPNALSQPPQETAG